MNKHTQRHTPGPWWLDIHENGVICIDADFTSSGICDLYHKHHETDEIVQKTNAIANGRLIAAAPEMLASLQAMQGKLRLLRWLPGFAKTARQTEKALIKAGSFS